MQNSFRAEIQTNHSSYQVVFQNQDKIIFRYETNDLRLAENLVTQAHDLFLRWEEFRENQTGPSGWATFEALCLAIYFPTRTGGHAIIFTEIENAYL